MAEKKRGDRADIEADEIRDSGKDSWQNPDELSLEGNPPDSKKMRTVEESPLDYLYADANKSDEEGEEDFTQEAGEAYADYLVVGSDDEGVMDQIDDYTSDEEILEDFSDRQRLHTGSDKILDELREHHSQSPQVSGGDVDAAWDSSVVSGEESVGGTVPTPDQDVVDELGEALGISYADNEPLATADKLEARDRDRWEMNPASMSLDDLEREEDSGDEDDLDDLDEDLSEDLEDEDEEEDEVLDELEALDELDDLDEDEEDEEGEYNGYDEDELEDELDELEDLDELDDDLFDDLDEDLWDDEED